MNGLLCRVKKLFKNPEATVSVVDYILYCGTSYDGDEFLKVLDQLLEKKERVRLVFDGVKSISSDFIDSSLGVVALRLGKKQFWKRIHIEFESDRHLEKQIKFQAIRYVNEQRKK